MSIWDHRAGQTAAEAAAGFTPVLQRRGAEVGAEVVREFGGVVERAGQPQGYIFASGFTAEAKREALAFLDRTGRRVVLMEV